MYGSIYAGDTRIDTMQYILLCMLFYTKGTDSDSNKIV